MKAETIDGTVYLSESTIALTDEGRRWERLDGCLVATPAPTPAHQRSAFLMARLLDDACPAGAVVVPGPVPVVLDADTTLQPDLVVARGASVGDPSVVEAPLLVVEVQTPSTALLDVTAKRSRYEEAGTPSYWVFDPDAVRLRAWDLRDGRYVAVADVTGDEAYAAEVPFGVTVVPSALV